jgi:hypothetical protein
MTAMAYLIHPHPLLFEHGDRLSRKEFLDRWEQMPELKNAELIDGVWSHALARIAYPWKFQPSSDPRTPIGKRNLVSQVRNYRSLEFQNAEGERSRVHLFHSRSHAVAILITAEFG